MTKILTMIRLVLGAVIASHFRKTLASGVETFVGNSSAIQIHGRVLNPGTSRELEQWRNADAVDPSTHRRKDEPPAARAKILRAMEAQTTVRDGVPFLLNSGDGHGGAAVVCLSEKVGSTAWKLLFVKALASQGLSSFNLHASPHKAKVKVQPHSEHERLLSDPAVPRFMFVRDPYSRLLSGYLDKASTMQRWRDSNLPMPCKPGAGKGDPTGCYSPGQPFSR